MNTNQQTPIFDSSSESLLESDMARLLEKTNQVVMKIKLQTTERHY
jgi:hypothetical protein